MNTDQLLTYINYFREKAERGKLIIFVGAGVSTNVEGMPSWNALIQNMASAIDYSRCDFCKHKTDDCASSCQVMYDYSADEFLKIPQYVYNQDPCLYIKTLQASIKDVTISAPLSSAIFDINPSHIITTNYDRLLESSDNAYREQYQVIIHDTDLLNAEKSKYIIKMHGDIQAPDTIVLKEEDYLEYSQKHILIELFVKSLLVDHTILFLGYSLNDYNIKLIISWLNYMRSQNAELLNNHEVGYIIFDAPSISSTQEIYFKSNNISIINIHEMPLIASIPADLTTEKGKRLYSFLRTIANPAFEQRLASLERTAKFISNFMYLTCDQIMGFLFISRYEQRNGALTLSSDDDYVRLKSFIDSASPEAAILKQMLINAGIQVIKRHGLHKDSFDIGDLSNSNLLHDPCYRLYITNKYAELSEKIKDDSIGVDAFSFYHSILFGYSAELVEKYKAIDITTLNQNRKVAFLHNSAAINCLETHRFDSAKVKNYIKNISSIKERNVYSQYIGIYEGNAENTLEMNTALEKLKEDLLSNHTIHIGSTNIDYIYVIQKITYDYYFFYFYNYLFFKGFTDVPKYFRPYIEAMLLANSDKAEEPTEFMGVKFSNAKYKIGYIDIDILTKFLSVRDLTEIIQHTGVTNISLHENNINFLVGCFHNLCTSILDTKIFGFRDSHVTTLGNIALLLNLVNLNEQQASELAAAMAAFLRCEQVIDRIFSIRCTDFRQLLSAFSALCIRLPMQPDITIVKAILANPQFHEYAINVDFRNLKNLLSPFLQEKDLVNKQAEITELIDSAPDFHQKILVLRLLQRYIVDEKERHRYMGLLASNFAQMDVYAIYDFVFSGWLTPSPEDIGAFQNQILREAQIRAKGVHTLPDHLEEGLECMYILYIQDFVSDLSILSPLSEGRPHLQFLLNPDSFDYTQVDFSNYMWGNFARTPKCMEQFLRHKEMIIPQMISKIKQDVATDTEKRILYGFFLTGDEVWNVE